MPKLMNFIDQDLSAVVKTMQSPGLMIGGFVQSISTHALLVGHLVLGGGLTSIIAVVT